jgi:hypothetical protein
MAKEKPDEEFFSIGFSAFKLCLGNDSLDDVADDAEHNGAQNGCAPVIDLKAFDEPGSQF